MNPIVASGAASLAGVLVRKISGQSSSAAGNVLLDPKEFERALNRAGASRERHAAHQQAADLRQRLMQRPEVEAAISAQPSGTVSGLDVRPDGSVSLRTSAGAVAVRMGSESRELAQTLYSVSAVQATATGNSTGDATQAPVFIPISPGGQGVALR